MMTLLFKANAKKTDFTNNLLPAVLHKTLDDKIEFLSNFSAVKTLS